MTCANRHADLWLSEFSMDPYELGKALTQPPHVIAKKGDAYGSRNLPARKNLIIVRHSFGVMEPWSDVINGLVASLGGWDELEKLLCRLRPVDCLIQLTSPIKNSEAQENNFIDAPTLGRLAKNEINLGFAFD